MNRPRNDPELHDYLDGRLDDEERKAFEARLASDSELAREVAWHRAAGRALREELPDLPPGFYARARARFEEQSAERTRRPRLLALKVAGLAVAAALVVVLVVPMTRKGTVRPVLVEKDAPSPASEPASIPSREDRAALPRPEPAAAAELKDSPSSDLGGMRAAKNVATAPPPPELERKKEGTDRAAASALMTRAQSSLPWRCEELPEGSGLSPESLLVIEQSSDERWVELMRGAAVEPLHRLGASFPSERVVLAGSGLVPGGCSAIAVTTDGTGIRIRPGGAVLSRSGGCAIAIPAGPSPVSIEKDSDAER